MGKMGSRRVLYAEDEFTNRKVIQLRLEKEGVECELAKDGVEALEKYHAGTFDMVILDYYMPSMNGDQVALEIRKVDSKIPIIAITSDDAGAEYLQSCGVNEIIIKPLHGNSTISRILDYLRDVE